MARVIVPGVAHHVTQRGNRGEKVFFADTDRRRYLELLQEYADKHRLQVLAYCLMGNHVHLVVVPETLTALAATLKPVHLRYAQHVNWTHNQTGRLWQGRFFSCPLDEAHCLAAIRYVERNPVRAGLVREAETYPFSSAAGHVGLRVDPVLTRNQEIEEAVGDWPGWLRGDEDNAILTGIRRQTRTGRPLGDPSFIDRLERTLRRILRPQPGGRPRKTRRKRKHG
jgi:putative transposase